MLYEVITEVRGIEVTCLGNLREPQDQLADVVGAPDAPDRGATSRGLELTPIRGRQALGLVDCRMEVGVVARRQGTGRT